MTSAPKLPISRFVARVLVPVALLASTAGILAWTGMRALETLPTVVVTPVAIIASNTPALQQKTTGLQAPGWIEPMPYATEVPALREGVIEQIHALEGERVEKGALLITLESVAQQIAQTRAEAELHAAQADVAAKTAASLASERTLALAIDAERLLRTARAALSEALGMRAKLDAEIKEAEGMEREARDEYTRKQRLVESGGASEGEVRRLGIRADVLAAKAESVKLEATVRDAKVAAAQADADAAEVARVELITEKRMFAEAVASLKSADALARARMAMFDEASLAVERSKIRAPMSGVVLTRLARPGSRVGGDAGALLTLYDPSSLQVRCDVPLKDAGKLMVGLAAEVRVDALPDQVFQGKIVRIVPQGDLQKNTVQCKVALIDPDASLRPDMLARVRILTTAADGKAAQHEALAIPAETLRGASDDGTSADVVIAIPDLNAARSELRRITLGAPRANGWVEVLEGLAAGDRIVMDATVAPETRFLPLETLKGETP